MSTSASHDQELTGDLATAKPPHSFSSHFLVVPERYYGSDGKLIKHDRVKRTPDHLLYAMMLDK